MFVYFFLPYMVNKDEYNIYISRLRYDVSVRLSVCLSVYDGSELAHYS